MKQFIKYTFATLCGLIIFTALNGLIFLLVIVALINASNKPTVLKPHSVYELKLEGTLIERYESDPVSEFLVEALELSSSKNIGLNDVLQNIQTAKNNPNIDGIYLHGGTLNAGYASMKEIRDALKDFKQSGKFVIAYADGYTQSNFYLASVADKVYLNDNGTLIWKGLASNVIFYTRALEKLGVDIQVVKVGEFKSAVEPFMLTEMSEANRLQLQTLQDDIWQLMLQEVAEERGLSIEKVDSLAAENLMFASAQDIAATGLITDVCYVEDIKTTLTQLTGSKDYKLVSHQEMNHVEIKEKKTDNKIAILYAEGDIADEGKDGIVRDKFVKTINDLAEENTVKAVVLRVNSPGGSAYASEQIWHALSLLKQKKPLVVSMGDYAASGGYYISCIGDRIYAQNSTITGSIGIFGLIPSFGQLANKVGIDFDAVGTHERSNMDYEMVLKGMNDESRELMQAEICRGYERFVQRCADGRNMTTDEIKTIAEGRVWSGKKAVELGLVDQIGSLQDAIDDAVQRAKVKDYKLVSYPNEKDELDKFLHSFMSSKMQIEVTNPIVNSFIPQSLLIDAQRVINNTNQQNIQARLPYQINIQ